MQLASTPPSVSAWEKIQKLRSDLSVLARKLNHYVENGAQEGLIDNLVLDALPLAEEMESLRVLDWQNKNAHFFHLRDLFDTMFAFLPHANAQRPIRGKMMLFMFKLLADTYPTCNFKNLETQNKLHQLLRRERITAVIRELSPVNPYRPRFPISDDELERFYIDDRKEVIEALLALGSTQYSTDPFENDVQAVDFFQRYCNLLKFSREEKAV